MKINTLFRIIFPYSNFCGSIDKIDIDCMMSFKFFVGGIFLTFFLACSEKINDYYSGIVVDELGRPVQNVLIREDYVGNNKNKTLTDKNGFFKFQRSGLPELVISKEGFINDTLRLVGSHAGEKLFYSPLITKDSTIVLLKGKNTDKLNFNYKEILKPDFDTILNPNTKNDQLFGVWLINGDKELRGFKLDSVDGFYHFGYDGNRYMRYIVNEDTITIFRDDYYYQRKGIIKSIDGQSLEILWDNKENIQYKKWKNKNL
ncbi:carboxypeptidase-like regulatory domain-containing protein [Epilithonimonas caeni]|uniref:carboxypeptidase-like regulatory domain-containing protein n=1 Tax=Epilithonimonas caeni TaxID=365343 RepID=UPI0012EC4E8B|nr:carboxypeptidase-like regulatory domain-containing protein [Epilithonimonas caeni]